MQRLHLDQIANKIEILIPCEIHEAIELRDQVCYFYHQTIVKLMNLISNK